MVMIANGEPCFAASVHSSRAPSRRARWVCSVRGTSGVPPVIFVLGGPGSGKGTQCARLATEFGYAQVGMGELLRAEAASGTERGLLIADTMKRGAIVPAEITMKLLRDALRISAPAVLLDGFPRTLAQAELFESSVAPCRFALYFHCDADEMKRRLLTRGETSGRDDDNARVINMRFDTYNRQTMPVVHYYRERGLLREVDSTVGGPEDVFEITKTMFEQSVI